jgi:hypothetical protein
MVRMPMRAVDKCESSRRVRGMLTSFIETLEAEDDKTHYDDEVVGHVVENSLDPLYYTAAIMTPVAEHWKTAIENELQSLRDNRTWIVVKNHMK